MNAETLQNLIFYRYRYVLAYVLMFVTAGLTLTYKLSNLLPGLSGPEASQGITIIGDATSILEQGVYLPYNVLQVVSVELLGASTFSLRLPSIIVAFALLIMMFVLIHMWHRDKIAIASILFLTTSSWFLTFARSGTPEIYIAFGLVLIFLSGTLMRHSKHPRLALIFSALAIPLALYAPYMIYMFGLYLVLFRTEIKEIISTMSRSNLAVVAVMGLSAMAPLLYAFIGDLDNLRLWLGVEDIPTIGGYLSNVLASVQHLLWSSQPNPTFHLGNLAMLDIFTSTMAALGLYHYEQHFNFLRTRFIIYGLGLAILVFGLTDKEANYFLVAPIIYILAATGIVTLLAQWNKIFPVNPFARTIALLPLAFAVLITNQYHLDRYFSAWALDPDVRAAYPTEPALLEAAVDSLEANRILVITDPIEYDAINFLLSDTRETKSLDLLPSSELPDAERLEKNYDVVILDANVEGATKKTLAAYSAENIVSDRQSKPIAYIVYDLSSLIGSATQY